MENRVKKNFLAYFSVKVRVFNVEREATQDGWDGARSVLSEAIFIRENIWRQSIRNKCHLGSTWSHSAPLSYYLHPSEIRK